MRYVSVGCQVPPPSISMVGIVGRTRSGATVASPEPSATDVTIFIDTHEPDARDSANPCRPRSMTSWIVPGYTIGRSSPASVTSDRDGSVDDLHAGSSPTRASTPLSRLVPA